MSIIDEPLPYQAALYWQSELPIEERVDDLLAHMTLQEKIRQLDMYQGAGFVDRMATATVIADDGQFDPIRAAALLGDAGVGVIHDLYPRDAGVPNAIQRWLRTHSRLGIPALFVEEALHGVCRPGQTVFPQAIALASTWNPALLQQVGAAIAAELRACNIHLSLSPVLDIVRDPRWGRTEETFGEDPCLTARLGLAYVQGMQGDSLASDHTVVAEPKHFGGHGTPEAGLNQSPVHTGLRELLSTHLAGYHAALTTGGAQGVMCAYHEIDGVPCAGNVWLLSELLRDTWGFDGVVISDLGAIRQLQDKHRVAVDAVDAICQALIAGVDIQFYDYDHATFAQSITQAIAQGRLPLTILDRAVRRILRLKMRLGLFDQPYINPQLARQVARRPEHLTLSLQAAREAICLLKNEHGVLPLRHDVATIAVLGPNAAVARSGDYAGSGDGHPISLLAGITALASPATRIIHVPGTAIDGAELLPLPASWLRATVDGEPGLRGEYFANAHCAGQPLLTRADATIDFNWAMALPGEGMPADHFSVRWQGVMTPDTTMTGMLGILCQDHMQCWIDGELLLSCHPGSESMVTTSPFNFVAGRSYDVRIEFRKAGGGSSVILGWGTDDNALEQAIAAARCADVAILALGESEQVSGEGIDRASLDLPGEQAELLAAVVATGTPTVLVLQNGRPLTLPPAAENASALLEAWYAGEQGGQAIAEVLFGIINPAGRLPITIPKTVGQLPLYYDHAPSVQGRYVECDHEPAYPFGHGLSYTTFHYDRLVITPERGQVDEGVSVQVDVTNSGERAGDEVVQLYVRDLVSSVTTPVQALKHFCRVNLHPGERRTLTFHLTPADLAILNRNFHWVVEPGSFQVWVGGSSEATLSAEFNLAACREPAT